VYLAYHVYSVRDIGLSLGHVGYLLAVFASASAALNVIAFKHVQPANVNKIFFRTTRNMRESRAKCEFATKK